MCRAAHTKRWVEGKDMNKSSIVALLVLLCVSGCHVSDMEDGSTHDQQAEILSRLKQTHPEQFNAMVVYGEDPSGNMLLFLVEQGGTYLFRKDTGKLETIHHAKLVLPSGITRITYSETSGSFTLWAGDRNELEIMVDK